MRIIFALILFLPAHIEPEPNTQINARAGISWEAWLPAIVWAESEGNPLAVSRKGAPHGRGKYQISEICLQHYKDENPGNEWITKDMLFNPEIAKPIALWYLRKCNAAYDEINPNASRLQWVFSAYNQGVRGTIEAGINKKYVERVMAGRRFMAI